MWAILMSRLWFYYCLSVFFFYVQAVKICQRPSCKSISSLPGVAVGNRKFFLKTINSCSPFNRCFVLLFRQAMCIMYFCTCFSVQLFMFLFIGFGAHYLGVCVLQVKFICAIYIALSWQTAVSVSTAALYRE